MLFSDVTLILAAVALLLALSAFFSGSETALTAEEPEELHLGDPARVHQALGRVSAAHREVIRLVRIEALSVREAAAGGRARRPMNRFMLRTS